MNDPEVIDVETSIDTLRFSRETGRLLSFRRKDDPDHELLCRIEDDPVFVLQYLDEVSRFRQISSNQAAEVEVRCEHAGDQSDDATITASFRRLDERELDVTVTVRTSKRDRFSHWSLALHNEAGLTFTDIQFPFVVLPYQLGGTAGSERLLWPIGAGLLLAEPKPQDLDPDSPHTWQMRPENSDSLHYPGFTVAQFLAYFDDRAGVYIGCQDAAGMIKQLKPVHHEPGVRLGIAHVGDWPEYGERALPYDVVVGSFTGDWYAAAELYRGWSLRQDWARRPLHARDDVPGWLLDSPPHIILRIQGELDIGPALPNDAFLPYARSIPLLERLAERLDAPLVPVIMSWERPGPWIYPDCFPPAGGADSLKEFTGLAREHDWHIGTFCNGTRWVTGHYWSGYDGTDYFYEREGARSVCRTHTGDLWHENWDATWRPSYACCLAAPMTREIAVDFVRTVMDYGLDWIQFFDQNVGCCTFPCFAADHGHPSVPGSWMTESMRHVVDAFHALARDEVARGTGRQIVFSVEGPVNEYFLQDFQICDIRVVPPGHRPDHRLWRGFVPLYHFLYHELVLIQGGFGYGPEPYHLPIRNAYNLVVGEIPGAVMKGDGRLLNLDTSNWAPWDIEAGDDEHAVRMLRAATALRRGPAEPFLVYGRMLAPAQVEQIETMRWQHGGTDHSIEAIFHAAWQAPDGRFGLVLANWTDQPQALAVADPRLAGAVAQHLSGPSLETKPLSDTGDHIALHLPPLSCALIESLGIGENSSPSSARE